MAIQLRFIIISLSLLSLHFKGITQTESHNGVGAVSEIIFPATADTRNNFNLFYEIHLQNQESVTPSFWYKIIFNKDCFFEFTLFPLKEEDTYDFFLFKIERNQNYCEALNENNIISLNQNRIYKTYKDSAQSAKFRANLVDIKPTEVKAGDAIYLEVFSKQGKDGGHILDFRTSDNSFVVKAINDKSSAKSKTNPSIEETFALKTFSEILCPMNSQPVFVSSFKMKDDNVIIQKKLDFTVYSEEEAPKYNAIVEKKIEPTPTQVDPPEKSKPAKSTLNLSASIDSPIKHNSYMLNTASKGGITKLEVDKVLFTLLEEDLKRKVKSLQDQLGTHMHVLKKTKDRSKRKSLVLTTKKIRTQKKELQAKTKITQAKIREIEKLIDKQETNEKTENTTQQELVFSKSIIQENNIPALDEKGFTVLPVQSGLIYKVQIGVYINRIREDIFKGLTPVFYEPFSGGVRYSAGAFGRYIEAKQAKEYIVETGLSDAFIVAYYNGKRISVVEAKKFEEAIYLPKE